MIPTRSSGYCGPGTGTGWTLWVCIRCGHMMGTRIHDVGVPDIAALDMGDVE